MIKLTKIFAFKNKISEYLSMVRHLHSIHLLEHIRPDRLSHPVKVFFLLPYVKSFFMAGKAVTPKKKGQLIHTLEPQIQALLSKVTTWSNAKTGKMGHKCIELDPVRVGYR